MGFEIINVIKKEKGLTNAQIAQLSGVTLSTLDKITSGVNTNPKLDTLQAICSVLGCTLNDFADMPSNIKKSPSTDESELGDVGQEIINLVGQLSPEQKDFLIALLNTIVARNPDMSVADRELIVESIPEFEHHDLTP